MTFSPPPHHHHVGCIHGPKTKKYPTKFLIISLFGTLQVTVKMYKRGSNSWLGKALNATTTIPSNTSVIFRISGEESDAKIPANAIHSITLSI